MVQPLWAKVGQLLIKLVIHLPYDPVIPLLEMKIYVHIKTCTWMFLAALFTSTKNWKQLKNPSTGEWINKLWYILSNKTIDTRHNMDASQIHYHSWKKPDSRDYIITFIWQSGKGKTIGIKNRSAVVRDQGRMGRLKRATWKNLGGDRTALYLYCDGYITPRICQNS